MNVLGSSPRRGHCVVFLLSKILYFHGASLHPVVINGYLQNNAGEGGDPAMDYIQLLSRLGADVYAEPPLCFVHINNTSQLFVKLMSGSLPCNLTACCKYNHQDVVDNSIYS